jgi:hypothetical protein
MAAAIAFCDAQGSFPDGPPCGTMRGNLVLKLMMDTDPSSDGFDRVGKWWEIPYWPFSVLGKAK